MSGETLPQAAVAQRSSLRLEIWGARFKSARDRQNNAVSAWYTGTLNL